MHIDINMLAFTLTFGHHLVTAIFGHIPHQCCRLIKLRKLSSSVCLSLVYPFILFSRNARHTLRAYQQRRLESRFQPRLIGNAPKNDGKKMAPKSDLERKYVHVCTF